MLIALGAVLRIYLTTEHFPNDLASVSRAGLGRGRVVNRWGCNAGALNSVMGVAVGAFDVQVQISPVSSSSLRRALKRSK